MDAQLRVYYEASCSFIIIGREYSDDGTPHLQGYCEFRRPSSLKDCKEINEYAHWEKAIASRSSNIEYCRKSDQDPYLFQDKKKGARTDLYAIYDKIKEGATVQEIMDLDFALWARNHRAISMAIQARLQPRNAGDSPPDVIWLYGPPGTGKTRYVYDKYQWDEIYTVDNSNDWEGYTQQRVVLIDEFHEGMISYRKLLRVLDRYPIRMNVKGSSVHLRSPLIYITCEYRPEAAFSELKPGDNIQALIRRIKKVKFFGNSIPDSSPNPTPTEENLNDTTSLYP